MTWKSTAIVSGVGVLATWLASGPPLYRPAAPVATPQALTPRAAAAAVEIQREADRLHARLQAGVSYRFPERNLFRFGARPSGLPRERTAPPASATALSEPVVVPESPTVRVALSGIAEDGSGDQIVRTAVISTPTEVLLVKEGELIEGQYKVSKIAADAVELTRLSDGTTVTLTFRP